MNPQTDSNPPIPEAKDWCKYCLILVCVLLGLEEAMLLL